MRELPILFPAPMVRALLDGRKTQTRRVVKPQPYVDALNNFIWNGWNFGQSAHGVPHVQSLASPVPWSTTKRVACPFGAPGDRLWVRETWAQPVPSDPGPTFYRADYPACVPAEYENVPPADAIRWKPSIHMPRWASRILLEITDVRVERLQDISEADARAEGVDSVRKEGFFWQDYLRSNSSGDDFTLLSARDSFQTLWDSLKPPAENAWAANPFVWVVEFKRVTAGEKTA